jgi:hypothetical protein
MNSIRFVALLTLFGILASRAVGAQENPAPGASAPADAAREMKELLSSPDAVAVARFQCATLKSDCPLTPAMQAGISSDFNGTLLTGAGADTTLASNLKQLLKDTNIWPAHVRYCAVHLVKHERTSTRDRWLLASRDRGRIVLSNNKRILGQREIAFAFVHVNVMREANAEALESKYSDLEIRAIVKGKLPANLDHLISLLKLATLRTEPRAEEQFVGLLGFGLLTGVHVPSDVTAFELRAEPLEAVGQQATFDDEGTYLWDVTVGMPVNKLSLLEYSDENGTILPKVVNKQSVYAMVNVYPWPVDIKTGTARWLLPRAVVGLGLTGRPGDNFLVGGAWGLPQLQFFVGSGFAVHREPKPGTDSTNGMNFTQKYSSRLTYGINIPVLSALKTVSGAAKGDGGGKQK